MVFFVERELTVERAAIGSMELKMSELSLLSKELFGDPNSAISDINFFPGTDLTSTPDDIAGALLTSLAAIRAGDREPIDLSI